MQTLSLSRIFVHLSLACFSYGTRGLRHHTVSGLLEGAQSVHLNDLATLSEWREDAWFITTFSLPMIIAFRVTCAKDDWLLTTLREKTISVSVFRTGCPRHVGNGSARHGQKGRLVPQIQSRDSDTILN